MFSIGSGQACLQLTTDDVQLHARELVAENQADCYSAATLGSHLEEQLIFLGVLTCNLAGE